MAANVYIEKERCDHVRYVNDTGADVSQYDFAVVGPYAAVADADITNGSVDSWHVEEGIQIASTTLKTGELTFGTPGQAVYWDATLLQFSDTETAGYYEVGHLIEAKSGGKILFEKTRYATLITT